MEDLKILQSALFDQFDNSMNPALSRRGLLAAASALSGMALAGATPASAAARSPYPDFSKLGPYGGNTLPAGVRPRRVPNVNGLNVNMLEAGTQGKPLILCIHGFPNLGYSYRKVMPALAAAGYYVVAPDCRGFGRTTGWDNRLDADPEPFFMLNMLRDQIALVYALGYRKTTMVVGHDQGALMASFGTKIRPDMFPRLTLIASGFSAEGPSFPFKGEAAPAPAVSAAALDAAYAQLTPPRQAMTVWWTDLKAPADTDRAPMGMSKFFRGFYYMKSHDYPGNQHIPIMKAASTAKEAAAQDAQIPEYYVMQRGKTMVQTVAAHMPSEEYCKNCKWLTDAECDVYGESYDFSGWTGPLHEYRHRRNNAIAKVQNEQLTWSGRVIDVPAQFLAGKQDWGAGRRVGGPMTTGDHGFTQFKGTFMVDGAGHWPHEEQPEFVQEHMLKFLKDTRA